MKCSTCTAIVNEVDVKLTVGSWSKKKHFNRICKYALERGKPCINDCQEINTRLNWEGYD
jgi:hypothetical protein